MKRFLTTTCCGLAGFAMVLATARFAQADETEWITLFDGTDLSAWQNNVGGPPSEHWVIEGDTVTRKERAGFIWTKEQFGDFVLELEFNTQGNSGVFFRTGDMRNFVHTGLEMQILPPTDEPNRGSVGAIYDAAAPSRNAAVEGWNRAVITAKGSRITVVMNGEQIIDIDLDDWTEPGMNPDGSKNKYNTALKDFPRKGHIGLQEHNDVVSFRNIRIRPL